MGLAEQTWSRRKFITTAAGAGTIIVLNPSIGWAFDRNDPKVAAIVAKTMGIDAHNHIDVPLNTAELPGPKIDLLGEMKKSGLSAITTAFAVDYQKLKNPGEAYERFINGLTATDKVLEDNNMKRALNLTDLKTAKKSNVPTVIQSVEGGHFLEGKIERLEVAYNRGLRHLTLLHDNDASVPLGDVFTNPAQFGGLTSFGADVIKECNRLGILIDLSHGTNDMVNAALKITTKPVLVSHTGLDTQLGQNENMAKMMKPRLISKEQAKIVASAGGVIGVWTHLAENPLEYAHNIKAMVNVVGIDHVCIGTDTKLTPAYRSPNDSGRPGGQGPQQGGNSAISKEGPKPDVQKSPGGDKNKGRMGGGTNQAWADQKEGFYYTVVDALLKTGFTEGEIAKIGGDNYCRVFDAATKGK
ncbi:peptidase M19 [Flavobacterium rivuli WB 3.3-2 = DSM 21788]|uniref:Peptidase M19 n=1 Tax=Flavobacterium rivuli WB 3.3-2 = DSM 21788 TaxID=1121895 RepID=A0A0A2M3Q2_9FLAO|nr:membrane dipeptidase [Flavobacterium rivuli]KGO86088.1 peptidase M19 [Flavobacterium rivuli WB 3.3-2 = DSM 21788]